MTDTITTADLADMLGISMRSISQYAKDGILTRAGMLAMPSRVQRRLPHSTAHNVAEIDREVRDALTETGNGEK